MKGGESYFTRARSSHALFQFNFINTSYSQSWNLSWLRYRVSGCQTLKSSWLPLSSCKILRFRIRPGARDPHKFKIYRFRIRPSARDLETSDMHMYINKPRQNVLLRVVQGCVGNLWVKITWNVLVTAIKMPQLIWGGIICPKKVFQSAIWFCCGLSFWMTSQLENMLVYSRHWGNLGVYWSLRNDSVYAIYEHKGTQERAKCAWPSIHIETL
jgi:hypothetical protein